MSRALSLPELLINTDNQDRYRRIADEYDNNLVCSYIVEAGSAGYIFGLFIVLTIFATITILQAYLSPTESSQTLIYVIAGTLAAFSATGAIYYGYKSHFLTFSSFIQSRATSHV